MVKAKKAAKPGKKPATARKPKKTAKSAKPARKPARTRAGEKTKRKKPRGSPISGEKYNEMLAAYLEKQSAQYVAKKCSVHWKTAEKYIERGDPARSLPPLRQRLADIRTETQRRENMTIAARHRDNLGLLDYVKVLIGRRIEMTDPKEIDPNRLVKEIKEISELEEKFLASEVQQDRHPNKPKLTQAEARAAAVAILRERRRAREEGDQEPEEGPDKD